MNIHRINLTCLLGKVLFFFVFIGILTGCKKDHLTTNSGSLAGAYSIFFSDGHVLTSGFKSENTQFSTKYWIDSENTDQSKFTELLDNQSTYRTAVDDQFRRVFAYKDLDGKIQNYQFDQGSLAHGGKIFYYKNNNIVQMGNDSIGSLSSVDFHSGKPYFAGYLGKITSIETGDILRPLTAFVWDGNSELMKLTLPDRKVSFHGISTIFAENPSNVYVAGLLDVPMYWQNKEPVILDERYGEVWQITKSGSDIYAVGFVNKYNSNSTGHTACYWKNGTLYELEDNAQAYGIFISGDDIYVCGAIGRVPIDYRPCYWKNGVRINLPM